MAVGMYYVSQRFYRVAYEWNKVLKIIGSAAIIFILFRLFHLPPLEVVSMVLKVVLIVAFTGALLVLKVMDTREITEIKAIILRLFNRPDNSRSTEVHP